jgi:4-alpha-glucanotransferase
VSGAHPDTDAWGVVTSYYDALGHQHVVSDATRGTIHTAMGVGLGEQTAARAFERVLIAQSGATLGVDSAWEISLEDHTRLDVRDALPPDLPIGYHVLRRPGSDETRLLIVRPSRCHLPARLRTWGWAAQSYALRSERSWGIGDLGDLARFAQTSASEWGTGFLLLNPLCAAAPVVPQEASPYSPSSRLFRNVLALDVEAVPGASEAGDLLGELRAAAQALNRERLIDRSTVYRLKLAALETVWRRFGGAQAFDRYRVEIGTPLTRFATFCVLAETFGAAWPRWPAALRHPETAAVARFASENEARVRFHEWMQWLLDEQLRSVSTRIALMNDLPIGFDPDGADAWAWQDCIALGARIGAPPDEFNSGGQNWGLPPFIPHRLAACDYQPYIQTLRAALRHARALRIDHVMGFFRLFWIPLGSAAVDGTYVRYPSEQLLAIAAVESHRARASIIGEDLGTVEAGVREQLAASGMPSYRLLWFEPSAPSGYPAQSLAAVTTHDLPTIAGVWTETESAMQRSVGLEPHEQRLRQMRARLAEVAAVGSDGALEDVIVRVHAALAQAPSWLVTATLEDALGLVEPPNRPGTHREWPNWSLALPFTIEQIERHPLARSVAQAMTEGRSSSGFE